MMAVIRLVCCYLALVGFGFGGEAAWFGDQTLAAGVEFSHDNGSTGEYYLPEITGSGGALFDYDGDGDLDLYLVQGGELLGNSKNSLADKLYRNDFVPKGTLTFEDVTQASGIVASRFGMGAAAADYDGDGDVDLYVTNLGPNQLFRNEGNGRFREVADQAGVADESWSTSASFVDYDGDGRLDLFVANYTGFDEDAGAKCYNPASRRDYCGPDSYPPVSDRLYHNEGDGKFRDVTVTAGLARDKAAGLGAVSADLNSDGRVDIYVANDGDPNHLWLNDGEGRFTEEALLSGLALNQEGRPEAGMGIAIGDADSDGDEDIFVAHLDGESNTLYVNSGDGFFEDRTIAAGLHAPSLPLTGFGTGFFDFDNDGDLDIAVMNGAVRLQDRKEREGESYPLQQANLLFENQGSGRFSDVTASAGAGFAREHVSRGGLFGDLDNDGDTDLVVTNNNGPARVLVNEIGDKRAWIGFGTGGIANVQVEISADDLAGALVRRTHRDGSYCSSSDPRVLFGLGDYGGAVDARVTWPDGTIDNWKGLAVGRYVALQKGATGAGASEE